MKTYPITDVRGDTYLNPAWPDEARSGNSITKIVVHHDASIRAHDYDSMARYRSEAAAHYQRLGPGLQYHFKIDNTGEIFWIRPFEVATYHSGDYNVNRTSVAICVDGYFHPEPNQVPTREQYEALKQLLDWLCTKNPQFPADQNDVYAHREITPTACCGNTLFPFVVDYRNSNGNPSIPNVAFDWPSMQPATPAPKPADTPIPPSIAPKYKVFKDGKQIGAYNEEANAWNKYIAEAGQVITADGVDVTSVLTAKYVSPAPPNPVKPPKEDPADTTNPAGKPLPSDIDIENNGLLKKIIDLLNWIIDKIKGIFK